MSSPGFRDLSARLVRLLNDLVRRGEISERGMARRVGYSQPHMHNVLHGKRSLPPEMADRVLEFLGLSIDSLLGAEANSAELSNHKLPLSAPLLAGRLGGGQPFPADVPRPDLVSFPAWTLEGLVQPSLCRVSLRARAMVPTVLPNDWALLDRSASLRRKPSFESIYALNLANQGYICRCQLVGGNLLTMTDNDEGPRPPRTIAVRPGETLEIIRAKLAWLARDL